MNLPHQIGGLFGRSIRKVTYILKNIYPGVDDEASHTIDTETGIIAPMFEARARMDTSILNVMLNDISYFEDNLPNQHTFYSLDNSQRRAINKCLSEYPKLLYYHGAHLAALREDCSLRNRKLEFLGFSMHDPNRREPLAFRHQPSVRDYLLSIGAGIGLDHDAYLGSLHRSRNEPLENPLITSEDYPAQLFIGADEKLLAYFQENGFYRNGVDSVEKLHTLLLEEKLTEEDKDRLVNQALFARRLNIFNSEITRSLTCVLGRLLYPNPAFHNIKILKAYVDFYNALIIAYHQKSATEKNSSGAHLLQTVLRVGTSLNDVEFPKLLDAVEDVNRGMCLRR